jgi:hypothetical protein
MKYASMNPPQYPIIVKVKDNTLSSAEKSNLNSNYKRNNQYNKNYWRTFFKR